MSEVYKALADPTRRRILELLREREMTAGDISSHVQVSKPTLSGHFAVLKAAGLVDVTRQGTSLIYRLNTSVLEDAIFALMNAFKVGGGKVGRGKVGQDTAPAGELKHAPEK